jgi:hypothetical protein
MWGIMTTGVAMFNGISGESVDPFYPSVYGNCAVADDCVEDMDTCLAHPASDAFHYHIPSPCQVDDSMAVSGAQSEFTGDVLTSVGTAFI